MTKTMQALVYDKATMPWDTTRGFIKQEMPRPEIDESRDPADGDRVIVKIIYAGFCGSDRGIWHRTAFKGHIFESLKREGATTRIIGHEMIGEIVETGSRVQARHGYRAKDLVSTESHIICGTCYQCQIGQTHICARDQIIGISRDGCFAEYIKLPAGVLWPTDRRKIKLKVAAVQEPFGNAVHACTAADLRGKTVAVFGCGTIGLFVIMIAKALGATRVIGVEPVARNREMALALGADEVIGFDAAKAAAHGWAADKEVVRAVREASRGIGADVSLEMAGFNSSVNNAIQSTRRGGEVVLFGLKQGNFHIQDLDRMIVNGLTLRSVVGRRIFETWHITRNLLEDRSNGIQKHILEDILAGGHETLVHIDDFERDAFAAKLAQWPKLLIEF
ncbi:MAG: alcohol dehydrogenase catalytic domain-containing protein [bacterium]|nr:alcohol dehydrogenase catalytic domain-containing protein [bacterium]MBK9303404.1 alcohol dehydrogenase catalytic domain-containing protein [bacterium]